MSNAIAKALAGLEAADTERERLRAVAAKAKAELNRLLAGGEDTPTGDTLTHVVNFHQAVFDSATRIVASMTLPEDLA